jgi:hypothetical protein
MQISNLKDLYTSAPFASSGIQLYSEKSKAFVQIVIAKRFSPHGNGTCRDPYVMVLQKHQSAFSEL